MNGVVTVLLLDDEEPILVALGRTLAREGLRVLTTTDPMEALPLIEREQVDVLISDLDMPRLSGLEVLERVRLSYPHVVRILLTGRATLSSAIRAINDGGIFRLLEKPWSHADLIEALRSAVGRIEELRRAAQADRVAERRLRMLEELEAEHPGITNVPAPGETYVLDAARLGELARRLQAT